MKPWLENIQRAWKVLAGIIGIIMAITGFVYTVRDTKARLAVNVQATKDVTARVDAHDIRFAKQDVTNEYMAKLLDRIDNKLDKALER